MPKYLKGMVIWSIAMVVFSLAARFANGHLYLWARMELALIVSFVLYSYCLVQYIRRNK